MLRLILTLLTTALTGAATAAPVTYAFYQGGYSEGAFVGGYFVGDDLNGDGFIRYDGSQHHTGFVSCSSCEVLDYFMFFSGNSLVQPFIQHGAGVLGSPDPGDPDDKTGFQYNMSSKTMPGEPDVTSCGVLDHCYDYNRDWLRAWDRAFTVIDGEYWLVSQTQWRVNFYQLAEGVSCFAFDVCGTVSVRDGANGPSVADATAQWLQVYRVPEPSALTLGAIGLAGLVLTRRRKHR